VFKNSIYQVLGNVISAVINLLIIVITARILGAEGRGKITYLITCIGLLQIFTAIIGNSVMVYMLTKYQQKEVLLVSFIWTLIIVIISIPIVVFTTNLSIINIIYFAVLGIVLTSFNNLTTLYSFQLKFRWLTILKIIQPVFLIGLIFSFSFFEQLNLNIYWLLFIISYAPHVIILLFETFKRKQIISEINSKTLVFDFLKLGGLNQINNLMQFVSYRFAVLLIMKLLSVKDVGVFGLWLTVTDAIWLIPKGLANVNMAYATKVDYQLQHIFRYTLISILLSASLITGILVIPNSFYMWILGKDFEQLKELIFMSSPLIVLFTINLIIANYFSAKGLIKYNTLSSGLGFLMIISFSYYLIKRNGLQGAVLANCLSYSISIITTLFLFFRKRKQFNLDSAPIN
jgi:O-antigen/teichoic acid export membrane protein